MAELFCRSRPRSAMSHRRLLCRLEKLELQKRLLAYKHSYSWKTPVPPGRIGRVCGSKDPVFREVRKFTLRTLKKQERNDSNRIELTMQEKDLSRNLLLDIRDLLI